MTCDEIAGTTPSGRTLAVRETGEHWTEREFVIDGESATIVGRPMLFRDGGTRVYKTDRGEIRFPHRIGSDDRTPRLDGEPVCEPPKDGP